MGLDIITKICQTCGKHFARLPKNGCRDWNKRKFCSHKCYSISRKGHLGYWKGKTLSEGTKMKMSEKRKGRKPMLGKKHSEETKKKISKIQKGKAKPWQIGKKNHQWKGGITSENVKIRRSIEYRLWREAVFARDNWICQKYGTKGGDLQAHHIQNFVKYPELRFAIDNGITFSKKAHKEFHKKYGIKNNTIEQLEEFLKL